MLASRNNMRRLLASFVLSAMAWSLVAPIALGVKGTVAPACCRRNGKHHCGSETSLVAGMSADDLPSFRVNPSDCPYRSPIGTPTGIAQPQSQAFSTLQPPFASFVSGVDSLSFHSRLASCNSQRGPPALAPANSEMSSRNSSGRTLNLGISPALFRLTS